MRAITISGAALVAGVLLALTWSLPTASADNGIHVRNAGETTDACAGCHRAHTGQAPNLLLDVQPGLCYTCHGAGATGATTAVESGSLYDTVDRTTDIGALRGGGFATARINTVDASLPPSGVTNDDLSDGTVVIGTLGTAATTQSWHTVDGAASTMWGNGAIGSGIGLTGTELRCGSCHDPHGAGTYRTLRPTPLGSGAAAPVVVTDEGATKNYGTADYLRPLSGLSGGGGANISGWCAQCHTRYLAGNSDSSGDPIFNYRHEVTDAGVPVCTNCHVAHGSNAGVDGPNSAAVEWPGGATGETDLNNSRLLKMDNRGICQKCHNK